MISISLFFNFLGQIHVLAVHIVNAALRILLVLSLLPTSDNPPSDHRLRPRLIRVSILRQCKEIVNPFPFAQRNILKVRMFELQMLNQGCLRPKLKIFIPIWPVTKRQIANIFPRDLICSPSTSFPPIFITTVFNNIGYILFPSRFKDRFHIFLTYSKNVHEVSELS